MKNFRNASIVILTLSIFSCDDVINPTLNDAPDFVVIDAWINSQPEAQFINLTQSQPYFDSSVPTGIPGARVYIVETSTGINDTTYFTEEGAGNYVWRPSSENDSIHVLGGEYLLRVETGDDIYESRSRMNRVPTVDSVTFSFEEGNAFIDDFYAAEFWSRDLPGVGDTYWIKAYRNDTLLGKPSEINIAYDAGFSEGGALDGLIFIPPIREGVNAFDEDEDGEFISPYKNGDKLTVELHSITNDAFRFLVELITATDQPGGFGALFAAPLNNVDSNIECITSEQEVVGYFCMSSVSKKSNTLDTSNIIRE